MSTNCTRRHGAATLSNGRAIKIRAGAAHRSRRSMGAWARVHLLIVALQVITTLATKENRKQNDESLRPFPTYEPYEQIHRQQAYSSAKRTDLVSVARSPRSVSSRNPSAALTSPEKLEDTQQAPAAAIKLLYLTAAVKFNTLRSSSVCCGGVLLPGIQRKKRHGCSLLLRTCSIGTRKGT